MICAVVSESLIDSHKLSGALHIWIDYFVMVQLVKRHYWTILSALSLWKGLQATGRNNAIFSSFNPIPGPDRRWRSRHEFANFEHIRGLNNRSVIFKYFEKLCFSLLLLINHHIFTMYFSQIWRMHFLRVCVFTIYERADFHLEILIFGP